MEWEHLCRPTYFKGEGSRYITLTGAVVMSLAIVLASFGSRVSRNNVFVYYE